MENINEQRLNPEPGNNWRDNRTPQTRMTFIPSSRTDRYGYRYEDGLESYLQEGQFPESRMNQDTRGTNAGKGPKSFRRSDESIKDMVCEKLTDDSFIDASNIEIDVSDGEIILSGSVSSRDEKRRAEDILVSIRGVSNLENRLRIRDNTHNSAGDSLRTGVKETYR